jgi:uncharacterized damage-inducible protein DinB
MSDQEFVRVRSFKDYQVTPQWTIHHLMQHEAEHRGEITSILEAYQHWVMQADKLTGIGLFHIFLLELQSNPKILFKR